VGYLLPQELMVRNGTFYFRPRVSKDIVAIYGRELVFKSMRTRDIKSPNLGYPTFIVATEREFEYVRRDESKDPSTLSPTVDPADFAALAEDHASSVIDRVLQDRLDLFTAVMDNPNRLWGGELGPLPAYFDRLVDDLRPWTSSKFW
jgi:hypothetical protein